MDLILYCTYDRNSMKKVKIPDFDQKYWKNEGLCIVWFFDILQNIHQTIK